MTEPKTNEAVADTAPDVEKIAKALFSADEGKPKKDAREALKKISGMWESLPVRLRRAIRADIGRLLAAGKSRAEIVATGYSEATTERALRDLGVQG